MKPLYPIFVKLDQKKILIVGGGSIAAQKIHSLLDTGCNITVVSPYVCKEIHRWASDHRLSLKNREFQSTDLQDVDVVFVATNQSKINEEIRKEVQKKKILINTVDDPKNCDFYVPSMIRRGPLSIAISTQGECPGFAKLLRKKLEKVIPPLYGDFLVFLGHLRRNVKDTCTDSKLRQSLMKEMLYDGILEELDKKPLEEVQEKVKNCISTHLY
jgi:precorrin-2 dehydrogenase/sirohydrochlorin ferrochelatase